MARHANLCTIGKLSWSKIVPWKFIELEPPFLSLSQWNPTKYVKCSNNKCITMKFFQKVSNLKKHLKSLKKASQLLKKASIDFIRYFRASQGFSRLLKAAQGFSRLYSSQGLYSLKNILQAFYSLKNTSQDFKKVLKKCSKQL